MNNVVEVNQLTKSYRGVTAVDNMSFSLTGEKIYGLLGRNGAGKTTIMQLITAQIFATSGSLKVFGEYPYENSRVLSQICFIKESQKYPDQFRVADVLELAKILFPRWDHAYAAALIEDFRLPLKRKMKALSRGMQSAVGIVVGLASHAPLTIFDEPYLGLDPVARSVFYDRLIEDYVAHPRTIILSTHLIDEVSRILEHVLVIDNGKLIVNEDADMLRSQAFTVTGLASKVEIFLAQKAVIDRKSFGALISATVTGKLDAENHRLAETLGLELAPVSLQQLIIQLTSGNSERKAVEAR